METVVCPCFWLFQTGSWTMTQSPGLLIGCHLPLATESGRRLAKGSCWAGVRPLPTPTPPCTRNLLEAVILNLRKGKIGRQRCCHSNRFPFCPSRS